ncbi:hypothetical protein BLNAU_21486 [Blattamonas nauphoetae]|uniref:Right handed beta helix domain-containing protein n=1 Tax=Blattamonas nauphoetae TaxID=2049346 RepID=A0ABQ9WVT3_9EUKA|nr:hypothetical protein BLNAU_21486 [Blattamonas nauphoetae]
MTARDRKIHSDVVNLQDVLNEHADDVTEIEVQGEFYKAEDIQLLNRNLTVINQVNGGHLFVDTNEVPSFSLENSSLTLVSFPIRASRKVTFATAKQGSILNLTDCEYIIYHIVFPILVGTKSQLILNGTELKESDISSSLIEGSADTVDPHLSLAVDNSHFGSLKIDAQKPLLAGPEVQNVTVFNCSFNEIHCEEDGPLPTEAIQGVASRAVIFNASHIGNVTGALSGGLVFGVQASSLTLVKVMWNEGTNAVRFSNNVAFSDSIEVKIVSSEFQNQTASTFWPNGGFLYLPHNNVHIKMSHTSIIVSSAPNGDGGAIYTVGRSTILVHKCQIQRVSAGKSGGFIFAGKNVDTVTLNALTVSGSTAAENGGFLCVDKVKSFQTNDSLYSGCHASKQGGVMFFHNSDNSTINFDEVTFDENKADSDMGQDVLISYESASKYNVKKKNFLKCGSTTKGHKVTLLPKIRHEEWTNTNWLKAKSIITGVVVGVCVFIAVSIALTCVCCCCGVCVACGCGKKKTDAYKHVESQPISSSVTPQQYQIQ